MKTALSTLCLMILTITLAVAQEKADSLKAKATNLANKANVDSLTQKLSIPKGNASTDSLKSKLPQLPDSLKQSYQKVDSIRNNFNAEADSLKGQYDASMAKLDATTNKLNHSIDSLEKLNLPTGKYTKKLDSVNAVRQKNKAEFDSKASALKAKTTDKLKGLDLPPQYNEPLQQITGKVDGFNLDSDFAKLPAAEVPGYSLPDVDGIGDLGGKTGDLGNIGDLGNAGDLKEKLPNIETPAGDLGKIGEQAKGYQEDLKNVTSGNLDDVKQAPKALEEQAGKVEGMQELQKGTGAIDEYKSKVENLNDPEKAKAEVANMAKEKAIDHFAGKQEQLKAAMDKISKYKQKYSSVSSIKDLPKRAPNAMKGKPLVERLIPGLFFQYQQKNYNLFDVNPYLGYKLSGRFTTGAGWNQRFAYDSKKNTWNPRARIFGPRVYVDFKLGKGFIAHLESEMMNTFVPSALIGNPEVGQREWVWGMMTGMKKEYKIYKNLRGTVLIQYNIFNPKYKSPYVDRLNSRIGFEYTLKKKKRKRNK